MPRGCFYNMQGSVQTLKSRCDILTRLRRRCVDQYGSVVNSRKNCIKNDSCCWRRSRTRGVPWCYITTETYNSQSLVDGQNTGASVSLTKRKLVYHYRHQFIIIIIIMVYTKKQRRLRPCTKRQHVAHQGFLNLAMFSKTFCSRSRPRSMRSRPMTSRKSKTKTKDKMAVTMLFLKHKNHSRPTTP